MAQVVPGLAHSCGQTVRSPRGQLVASVVHLCSVATEGRRARVRTLASIVGRIISMKLAFDNMVRLMTRVCYRLINTCASWAENILLNDQVLEEVEFWKSADTGYKGARLVEKVSAVRIVYSDASDVGFGGFCIGLGDEVVQGNRSLDESKKSSMWLQF